MNDLEKQVSEIVEVYSRDCYETGFELVKLMRNFSEELDRYCNLSMIDDPDDEIRRETAELLTKLHSLNYLFHPSDESEVHYE